MEGDTQEVIIASTSTDQSIGAWDVHTGTLLTNYKGNACGRNALSLLGSSYMVSAQSGKGQAIHFWTWEKDQIHQRSFTSQQIVSIACSPCGVYCAAGSNKGTIFIWESASGKLLKYWNAHYKAVNALAFTKDSSLLVSGGEDASVSAWLLMQVLDEEEFSRPARRQPFASWTSHMLPVTAIHVGTGSGDTLIFSASLDKTCKAWSLEHGKLLFSENLPSSLHCVTVDRWEGSLFLGGGDGRIFQVGMYPSEVKPSETHANGQPPRSEDASIKVWDIQSRQCIRTLAAKGPVTNVLVINRPDKMGHGRGNARGKKAASRIQPLGVFAKQVEVASNLYGQETSWEPPPVILDGSQSYRGIAEGSGLLESDVQPCAMPGDQQQQNQQDLEAENLKLKQKMESAMQTISDLRATNAKLHAFVVQKSGNKPRKQI